MKFKLKKWKEFNIGGQMLFLTIGLYITSIFISLSLGSWDFANEVVDYLVPAGLASYGYSLILNNKKKELGK